MDSEPDWLKPDWPKQWAQYQFAKIDNDNVIICLFQQFLTSRGVDEAGSAFESPLSSPIDLGGGVLSEATGAAEATGTGLEFLDCLARASSSSTDKMPLTVGAPGPAVVDLESSSN